MSSPAPKHSGWRVKGKTKYYYCFVCIPRYYLSLTSHKYFKPYAFAACQRDKRILQKKVEPLRSDVCFEHTVNSIC